MPLAVEVIAAPGGMCGGCLRGHRTHETRGDGEKHQVGAIERFGDVVRKRHVRWDAEAGEVGPIFACLHNLFRKPSIVGPNSDAMAKRVRVKGERGTKRTGTQNADLGHSATIPWLLDSTQ